MCIGLPLLASQGHYIDELPTVCLYLPTTCRYLPIACLHLPALAHYLPLLACTSSLLACACSCLPAIASVALPSYVTPVMHHSVQLHTRASHAIPQLLLLQGPARVHIVGIHISTAFTAGRVIPSDGLSSSPVSNFTVYGVASVNRGPQALFTIYMHVVAQCQFDRASELRNLHVGVQVCWLLGRPSIV